MCVIRNIDLDIRSTNESTRILWERCYELVHASTRLAYHEYLVSQSATQTLQCLGNIRVAVAVQEKASL